MRALAAVVLVGALLTGGASACGGAKEPFRPDHCLLDPQCGRPMVAAHRGFHLEQPENSLAALRAAAGIGADFAEIDVRHTRDGVLVLMHDAEVDRTTDGSGQVEQLTWAQLQALLLDGGDPDDPESSRVPLFSEALSLAREVGIMLYVDVKTDRGDLVLAEIQRGSYHRVALLRDDLEKVAALGAEDVNLLVMPPVDDQAGFAAARQAIPSLAIVEFTGTLADAGFNALAHGAGVKVQQDVMAAGDVLCLVGDYSGWKGFVEAGVDLLQTDFPQLLIPALRQYLETGVFPDTGPAGL